MSGERFLARIWRRLPFSARAPKQEPTPSTGELTYGERVYAQALHCVELALSYGGSDFVIVEKPCAECRAKAERLQRWRLELAAELAVLQTIKAAERGEVVPVMMVGTEV
jgi:hypothetical protein